MVCISHCCAFFWISHFGAGAFSILPLSIHCFLFWRADCMKSMRQNSMQMHIQMNTNNKKGFIWSKRRFLALSISFAIFVIFGHAPTHQSSTARIKSGLIKVSGILSEVGCYERMAFMLGISFSNVFLPVMSVARCIQQNINELPPMGYALEFKESLAQCACSLFNFWTVQSHISI